MPIRRLALAALLALPLAACGGGSSDSGGQADAPGEQEYRRYACQSCHSLDGSDRTGPTFQGLADSTVTLEGGKQVKADAAYLERAITDPDAEVVEGYDPGLMQAGIDGFDLESRPEEVRRLVEFIQASK